jgi:hypothetical protein
MSVTHLDRLRHIRDLLTAVGRPGAAGARLLCFSGAGFTDGLAREAAARSDVVLVGATDLYASSAGLSRPGTAARTQPPYQSIPLNDLARRQNRCRTG